MTIELAYTKEQIKAQEEIKRIAVLLMSEYPTMLIGDYHVSVQSYNPKDTDQILLKYNLKLVSVTNGILIKSLFAYNPQ